jgi:hypothetical protein
MRPWLGPVINRPMAHGAAVEKTGSRDAARWRLPMADDGKWAKEAFKKSHKGRLHRALGVDENETIPEAKMQAALRGDHGAKVQHMAQAAHNINK